MRARFRALPDVSLLADISPGYAIFCSNSSCLQEAPEWRAEGGTSAATPLLAGGFALVDQALRMNHRQDLGLANPLLYALGRSASARPRVFDDVTRYGNDVGAFIGNRPLGCCSAHPGFDYASGWGSVNLAPFADAALALQPPIFELSVPGRQSPVKRREITVTVSCQAACRLAAAALVTIGRAKPFEVDSTTYRLAAAGSKKVQIHLGGSALRRLRAGLKAHKRVSAQLFGLLLNGSGNVISETGGQRMTIKG